MTMGDPDCLLLLLRLPSPEEWKLKLQCFLLNFADYKQPFAVVAPATLLEVDEAVRLCLDPA